MSFCRPSDYIQLLALPSEGSTASDTSSIPLQRDQGWHHEPSQSPEKFLEPWLPQGGQVALISEAALQADLCSEGAHLTVLMFPLLSACRVFRPGRRESAQWCCQQGSAALCHPAKVSSFPAQQVVTEQCRDRAEEENYTSPDTHCTLAACQESNGTGQGKR